MTLNPQYIIDSRGRKKSVLLSLKEFNQLIEYLGDIEDIKIYKEAKLKNEASMPFDEYLKNRALRNNL
jgi:hypothetical protein